MSNSKTFEDIVEDFIERLRNGENINIDRFAADHPEFRVELQELLPLVSDMEKLNISWDTDQLPELQDSDFKLLKKIGVGGMGNIYEAEQLSLQRKVAVKVLSPRLFEDEAQKLQFVNEAKLIAQLHHPNIIKIIDAKSSGVYCYYIMELINGTSLDHLHPANITETVKLGIQAAQALDYAHNCGILHRDIKPGNFLLDENGFLHLGDFGLSVLQSKKDASFSDTAGGTLRYMAPEQLTDFESSVQSDIYAFGATLYELSFNRPPFSGSSISDLKEKICNSTPTIPADTPRGFAAILKKCLHKNPAKRYRSAAEVAADLQRFLNHEAVSADKVSPLYRLKLWMKRKPVAAAWAITAMIFLAAAFGALLIGINQTGKALKQTEFNAHLADQTLEKIFSRLDSLPSSQKNNRLLTELLPYYQQIIRTKKLPEDKLYSAYKIIVKSAIRCGDYPLAETTLRKMLKMYDAPDLKNMLAMVLKRQNRFQDADILHRE
ncbi:MAG: serine/threonine protein kinase, partial [Lentisphaeria bacterium]|nr:serine/threonine protein kinase [Lentisphaeria bacterium]